MPITLNKSWTPIFESLCECGCMRVFWFAIFIDAVLCHYNDKFHTCKPANCADGSCYCTDYRQGWYSGGSINLGGGSWCSSAVHGQCMCPDCGDWDNRCTEQRCNDENGFYEGGQCYTYVSGVKTPTNEDMKDACFRNTVPCDTSTCDVGEFLVGCGRTKPGSCQPCPNPPTPLITFWPNRGKCDISPCTKCPAGEYILTPCTIKSDTKPTDCHNHPGNPGYIGSLSPTPTYYCPPGGLAVPLPANSGIRNNDYSKFFCDDGYFQVKNSCVICPQGSACINGINYPCPMDYYQHLMGQTTCTLCTWQCGADELPLRCEEGSTYDPKCISCNGCFYTATGHTCNQTPMVTGRKSKIWTPSV